MRKCKSKKKEFLEKRENNPQITHRIFQKKTIKKLLRLEWNIDTKLSIWIKRWFVVKQAPLRGGESQLRKGACFLINLRFYEQLRS